jgi:hypothetical protein
MRTYLKPVILALGLGLFLLGPQQSSAYYNSSSGKWINRDPLEEEGGANLYLACRNDCISGLDPLGLKWRIDRFGAQRAFAIPEAGDTVQILAMTLRLNPSEYRSWLTPIGGSSLPSSPTESLGQCSMFTVPNTVYVDVSDYNIGLAWLLSHYMVNNVVSSARNAGNRVYLTEGAAVNATSIVSHLSSTNIYKYFYLGHGYGGALSSSGWALAGKKYTPYGIGAMWITACGASLGDQVWRQNVSYYGWLIVADDDNNNFGSLDLLSLNFRFVQGVGP